MKVVVTPQTDLVVDYQAPDIDPAKGPVWITLNQVKPLERLRDKIVAHRHKQDKNDQPRSEEIKNKKGLFKHRIETGGEVSICVRASPASSRNPMRFGLACSTNLSRNGTENGKEDKHLSLLELQMERLSNALGIILKEADFAKERETIFHGQSISMNAASMWWPIVQLGVLLLTGFTQVRHMVRFFKSRHII